jgi:hypothetical protein
MTGRIKLRVSAVPSRESHLAPIKQMGDFLTIASKNRRLDTQAGVIPPII